MNSKCDSGGRRSAEEFSTIGVGNLKLPLPINSLEFTPYIKTTRRNLGLTPPSHFLEGEHIQWQCVDKAKNVRIIVRQLPTKARWWDSLIWTFFWKSKNPRCFNCLLAGSFVSTKIYFNITVSVFTTHYLVLQTSKWTAMSTGCLFCFSRTWSCLLLSFFYIGNHRGFFSTGFLRHQLKPMHIEQIYEFIQGFWKKIFW